MRLPVIKPDEMTGRQQEIAARIAGRRGAVRGPFQVWLNSPELCERVEALGAFVRWESALPPRLRELSLLIAARHVDAQYSWNAHVAKCVEEGIPQAAVDAIARNETPEFDDPEVRALHKIRNVAFSSNSYIALQKAAVHGRGIALLPVRPAYDDLMNGTLKVLLPELPVPSRSLYAIYGSAARAPRKVEVFLSFLTEWFSANPIPAFDRAS